MAGPIRIACEEAFALPEQVEIYRALGRSNWRDPDVGFWRFAEEAAYRDILDGLLDLGEGRLATMDAHGVDMQLLLLTSPGVQVLTPEAGTALARLANDRAAEAVAAHPDRFAALAAIAPQDPAGAVAEMERAVRTLGMHGFVVNSHTDGHYLDEDRFRPILEAAEALDRPIYIHPRILPADAAGPYRAYGLTGGLWGYAAETGLHAMRMIMGGVFDRHPRLKVVLGHMGEGLPYWLYRMDYMYRLRERREPGPLAHPPSHYVRTNFAITTSGMNDPDVLAFCIAKLGADSILWAIDHPYQETAEAVEFMAGAPVSEADRAKMFGGNAQRVFGLAGAARS